MTKKQSGTALFLFLLIPLVTLLGGLAFSFINPEWGAGHPSYLLTFRLLTMLRVGILFGSFAAAGLLWLLVCYLVVRYKKRSNLWLLFVPLGPLGFAVLASLTDLTSTEVDSYSRFLGRMNLFVRSAYEVLSFVIIWELAWQAMILKRMLEIRYEAATTGVSVAQIVNVQNASSGMWAFGEGIEVMYLAVLLYLLRPFVYRVVAYVAARRPVSAAS